MSTATEILLVMGAAARRMDAALRATERATMPALIDQLYMSWRWRFHLDTRCRTLRLTYTPNV